jgi:branched-chain amino acid transport system ATP-binding protein
MSLLEIQDLHLHYDRVEAVRGASLSIEYGSIVSLIGANGAGKSSILKAIFGLEPPSSGRITLKNKPIHTLPSKQIARMGVAFSLEGRRLFPRMSVSENLEMGAFLIKDKARVRKNMERIFGLFPILEERSNQLAGTLSGGQQQIAAIGRALMGDPELLLLDEPSLGLAPLVVKDIARIIKEINQSGVSVLLVEQNTKLGLGVAQHGYVLEVGRVVLSGPAGELMQNQHVQKAYLGG